MAQWVDIPMARQVGEGDSAYASDIELTNLMLRRNPPEARAPFHIGQTPALSSTDTSIPSSGVIRGICHDYDTGAIYVVQGTTIYVATSMSNFAAGTWTNAGAMPGTAKCRSAYTGTHVVFVDGTNARCVNASSYAVSTPSIEGFIDVAYQDGYTIYAKANSDSVYVSSLDDPTTIGALDFTTVDAVPGKIVGIISDHRELLVIKTKSVENYYNAGGAGFPFVRSSPGMIEVGGWNADTDPAYGTHAIAKHGNAVIWVSNDHRVYAMQGHQPVAISTDWVTRTLRRSSPGYLYGSVVVLDGTAYYILSGDPLTSDGTQHISLVCDLSTGLWHQRYSPLGSSLYITHAVQQVAITGSRKPLVVTLNGSTGGVYALDHFTVFNDSGASGQTSRVMTLPQLDYGERRAFMYELALDMQKPSTTGTITLQWSDDGGATPTYSTGVTNTGANARTRFQRLGSFHRRIPRLTFAINSRIAIMGIRARIEVGE